MTVEDQQTLAEQHQALQTTTASITSSPSPEEVQQFERSLRQLALAWENYYLPKYPGPFFCVRVADVRAVGGSWNTALMMYEEVGSTLDSLYPPQYLRRFCFFSRAPNMLHSPSSFRSCVPGPRAMQNSRVRQFPLIPILYRSLLISSTACTCLPPFDDSSVQESEPELLPAMETRPTICQPFWVANAPPCSTRYAGSVAYFHDAETIPEL